VGHVDKHLTVLCVVFATFREDNPNRDRYKEILSAQASRVWAMMGHYGAVVDVRHSSLVLIGAGTGVVDHAERACLAAWDIQQQATRLAAEAGDCGDVDLRPQIALSSGRVSVYSDEEGYSASGEPMDNSWDLGLSTPSGAVMLSESTARLVEGLVVLAEPEMVRLYEGPEKTVRARRLLSVGTLRHRTGLFEYRQ
jgi:hypothetical protein